MEDPNVDLLVLTALAEEQQVDHGVLSRCAKRRGDHGAIPKRVSLYEYTTDSTDRARPPASYLIATACRHAMGAVPMSSFATALFSSGIRPGCAVLVGIAATVNPAELDLGDLPIATDVFAADDIAVENGGFTFRTRGYPVDPRMRNAAGRICEDPEKHERWGRQCRTLIEAVVAELNRLRRRPIVIPAAFRAPLLRLAVGAGGPFLIRDADFGGALRRGSATWAARGPKDGQSVSSDAEGTHELENRSAGTKAAHGQERSIETKPVHPKLEWVEMEAHGFMEAAHEGGVKAIVMKGISDAGDGKKAKLEEETGGFFRAYSCSNAVVALLHLLEERPRAPITLDKRIGGLGSSPTKRAIPQPPTPGQREAQRAMTRRATEEASVLLTVQGDVALQDLYVERTIEAALLAEIRDSTAGGFFLIVGEAGAGKTSLLWSLQGKLRETGIHEPWLLKASFTKQLTAELVKSAVAEARAEGLAPVLLLDTVDLLLHHEEDRDHLLGLLHTAQGEECPLVLTCRPREVQHLPEEIRRRSLKPLSDYDEGELDRAIDRHVGRFYSRAELREREEHRVRLRSMVSAEHALHEVCAHPLTLRMIFVLYAPGDVPPELDGARLYDEFWKKRVRTDHRAGMRFPVDGAPDLGPAAGWLAMTMLAEGSITLDSNVAEHSLRDTGMPVEHLSALVDRGVLRLNQDATVEFFHQTFFEHAAARGIVERLRVQGLDLLHARVSDEAHSDDLLTAAVLEQALLISQSCATDVRDAADRVFDVLLRASQVTQQSAAIALYARRDEVPDTVFRAAALAMQSTVVADRFIASIASIPATRSRETFDHLAAIWHGAIDRRDRWANCQHMLDELPRLAMRRADAPRVRGFLERFHVRDAVLRRRGTDTVAARKLLVVFAALTPHDPKCWDDFAAMYREAKGDLREAVVRTVARQAKHLPERLGARFEAEVAPERSKAAFTTGANQAWGTLWAAAWRRDGCPVEGVLDEVRRENDERRLRRKLNGLRDLLRDGTREDGASAWAAFLAETDHSRRAEWSCIVWQELLAATPPPAAIEACADGIANLLAEPAGDTPLRKLMREAVYNSTDPDTIAARLLGRPEVGDPARWLAADDLGLLLPFARARHHVAATEAMKSLIEKPRLFAEKFVRSTVVAMIPHLARWPELVDPLVRLTMAADLVPDLLHALGSVEGPVMPVAVAEAFRVHKASLLDLARHLLDSARELDRRQGAHLWSALIHHQIVPRPDVPTAAGIVQKLRRERDGKARAALAILTGMTVADAELADEAMAALFEAARSGGEYLRHEAFSALIRVARVTGTVPATALELLDFAAEPPSDSRFFREVGWLVADLVPAAVPIAKELVIRLVTSSTVTTFDTAARREIRSTLRTPMRAFMAAASPDVRREVLELCRGIDVDLSCMLIDAASREGLEEVWTELKSIHDDPSVDPHVKKLIAAKMRTRQNARPAKAGGWRQLVDAMHRRR
ncbi:MAG: NACHT domain-containing protein [Myxococcaceae bacterium]